MRVADYIASALADHGITDVFLVTGGGAMHLNDAIGRERRLRWVPCHHEQACAIAAESYHRLTNRLAAINVTSGPGGTNAITGVWGAWVDSLAMVVISGNVKWETMVRSTGLPLRQLGDQEADIVPIVRTFTKYAAVIEDPASVRYHVERALWEATRGRPGPVWLDVPMNVQGAQVDSARLEGFTPPDAPVGLDDAALDAAIDRLIERLDGARRPVVLASSGIWRAGAHAEFLATCEKLGAPVTTAWNSHDLIWDDHPLYAGRPGSIGDRPGNFAVQNADLLLSLGCRLSLRQVSYAWTSFAREAWIASVDVDAAELQKPTVRVDLPIHADVGRFLRRFHERLPGSPERYAPWVEWCRERVRRYPVVGPEHEAKAAPVNPYLFPKRLFEQLPYGAVVVCGDGTACVTTFQAAHLKPGQRLYHNSGCAPMGYDLPAAVGASVARGRGPVVCIAGDGSIMMNLQELQTIVTQRLPVRIFVINNAGYHSIRQTQQNFFPDNPIGYDAASGVGLPDFERLAGAFGIPFRRCAENAGLEAAIAGTLSEPCYAMCEVVVDAAWPFAPKLASRRLPDGRMVSSPLEDLHPFLSREELATNLLIAPASED